MPANLTPAYREAEARFRAAVTREEKIAALEEMLRVIPKHKGTEKLQADIRSRIARLRREPARKSGARGGPSHRIPREGAGQIALVGPPNSGKSTLVASLTNATPEVAPYPMTTRAPVPGMMPFRDVAFQLLDLPPLCDEYVEPWVYDLIRGADMAWILLSVREPLVGLDLVLRLLRHKAIEVYPAARAEGDPAARRPGWTYRAGMVVMTGMDLPGAAGDLEAFAELAEDPWPTVGWAAVTKSGAEELGERTFDALDIIRVYSKEPRKAPDMERPFTLRRGATVEDLARAIHKDLAHELRSARIWGPSAFDGQAVHESHVLQDGDVVELHR